MAEPKDKTSMDKLKKLLGMEYEDFVKNLGEFADDEKIIAAIETGKKDGKLNDENVVFTTITIPVRKLHPTQNEIDFDKSLKFPLSGEYPKALEDIMKGDNITIKAPIITLNGKYIIDGHHRWSQVYAFNADATMKALNMTVDDDPLDVLKAVQLSIAATIGEVPTQKVDGDNLLDTTELAVIKYVKSNISDKTMSILVDGDMIPESNKDAAAEFVWDNVKKMQKTSQPIKDAPDRDVMPQTDDAEANGRTWKDFLKAGVINFKEPIMHENKYEMKHVKLFEAFNESMDSDL